MFVSLNFGRINIADALIIINQQADMSSKPDLECQDRIIETRRAKEWENQEVINVSAFLTIQSYFWCTGYLIVMFSYNNVHMTGCRSIF